MNVGDAILFNFKVLHSSLGNNEKKDRKAFLQDLLETM